MNLDVKKITILAFVIIIMQMYLSLPTVEALFVYDDKVPITMAVKEARDIRQGLSPYLNETQVKLTKIEDALNMIDLLEAQLRRGENLGIIITKMDYAQELIKKKLIRPIEANYANSLLKEIDPIFDNEVLYHKGDVFGLPIVRKTLLMFYNIDAIRNSSCELENFTEADIPKTWQGFEKLLERCQDKGKKQPLLLGGEAYDWIFQSMVAQQGGSLIGLNNELNLTSPEAIKTLEIWKKLKEKNLIEIENHWVNPINVFKRGASPIVCFSTDGIAEIMDKKTGDFKWTIGHLPIHSNAKVTLGGLNIYWGANMTDAQIEASKELIELLYSSNVQQAILEAGSWPIRKGVIKGSSAIGNSTAEIFDIAFQQLSYLSKTNYSSEQTEIINVLQTAIRSVLYDKASPAEALQAAQDKIKNK